MTISKIMYIVGSIVGVCVGVLVLYSWGERQYHASINDGGRTTSFSVQTGDNAWTIGEKLVAENRVSSVLVFAWGTWKDGYWGEFRSGEYTLPISLSAAEIAYTLTRPDGGNTQIKVTFPEGWSSQKMAQRLREYELPADDFLKLVSSPTPEIIAEFYFLKDLSRGETLEGYLFPDTYLFFPHATARDIVEKMLQNFDRRIPENMRANSGDRTLREVVIMASIIENEVRTQQDRAFVSGILWKRVDEGMRLQSDATLAYALGTNKVQHSVEETQEESPYNTYRHEGLPPGPISNPSLESIQAALHPTASVYYYFVNNPDTGETLYAKTFEEHKVNKQKAGL